MFKDTADKINQNVVSNFWSNTTGLRAILCQNQRSQESYLMFINEHVKVRTFTINIFVKNWPPFCLPNDLPG